MRRLQNAHARQPRPEQQKSGAVLRASFSTDMHQRASDCGYCCKRCTADLPEGSQPDDPYLRIVQQPTTTNLLPEQPCCELIPAACSRRQDGSAGTANATFVNACDAAGLPSIWLISMAHIEAGQQILAGACCLLLCIRRSWVIKCGVCMQALG